MTILGKGQTGRIDRIDAPARVTRRLAELGVTLGATVEMLRPGCPCILRVNQTRLSMSRDLQACITVSEVPAAERPTVATSSPAAAPAAT